MFFDKSWMGYGMLGGLEAGLIVAVVVFLIYGLLRWLGRKGEPRNQAATLCAAAALGLLLGAGGDLWDSFYLNYAPMQSIALIQARLAEVHDPDGLGLRVFFDLLGAAIGAYLGWLVFARRRR